MAFLLKHLSITSSPFVSATAKRSNKRGLVLSVTVLVVLRTATRPLRALHRLTVSFNWNFVAFATYSATIDRLREEYRHEYT